MSDSTPEGAIVGVPTPSDVIEHGDSFRGSAEAINLVPSTQSNPPPIAVNQAVSQSED